MVAAGEIWEAHVPYREDPDQGKLRPVLILAVGPSGPDEDEVVLTLPITGFHGNARPRAGDVAILNWRQIEGLTDPSWVRARRVWAAHPSALTRKLGGAGLPEDTINQVVEQFLYLFE